MGKKRIAAFCLVVVMVLCGLPMKGYGLSVVETEAATLHTREEAVNWATSQIGKGLDYDGAYGNQCVDLIKYYYNYLENYQTYGNACDYAYNALPDGWVRVYGNYQPGDIGVWKTNYGGTGKYGHVGIITSADSVGFNAVNQNYNYQETCTINWFNNSVLQCAIRPDFDDPVPVQSASIRICTELSDVGQNQRTAISAARTETNWGCYAYINNPSGAVIGEVGIMLYDSAGNQIGSKSENYLASANRMTNAPMWYTINEELGVTLTRGTTYQYKFYAVVGGQRVESAMAQFTTKGKIVAVSTEPPVILEPTSIPTVAPTATSSPAETHKTDACKVDMRNNGDGTFTVIPESVKFCFL